MYKEVVVVWTQLDGDEDPLWADSLCLYAYGHPRQKKLLCVGKADFATVADRLGGRQKRDLFEYFLSELQIDALKVFHGNIVVGQGERRTSELLADIESLLITGIQPFGNISATKSRISRPGLKVTCQGEWPLRENCFIDPY